MSIYLKFIRIRNAQAVNLQLPPELFQALSTFPLNVIFVIVIVLIVGIIFTLTRKPAHSGNPSKNVNFKNMAQNIQGSETLDQTADIEEEIPKSFERYLDGIVALYNWFYRFAQKRYIGISDNMTPREFKNVVLLKSPSIIAPSLDYLVTVFEIANYSNFKLTKEMLDKSFEEVKSMKEIIEDESSHLSNDELKQDEPSSTTSNYDIHEQEEQGISNILNENLSSQ